MKLFNLTTTSLSAIFLAACGSQPMQSNMAAKESAIPAAIKASEGEKLAFVWGATGTQNYECKINAAGLAAWAFVAPDAQLFLDKSIVGSHGAGPFWMALDGSKTVGTVKARADAPNPQDIPWLLLAAKSAGVAGKMSNVTSIQRINTKGGVAASTGCSNASDVGKISKIAYTSDYAYFVAK